MVEPSACLVDPTDIVAHLFFAVGTRDEVVVSFPNGDFTGVLGNPDGDVVALTPTRVPPSLPAGTPLVLEHLGLAEKYHFYSEVVAHLPRELRIRVPEVIERNERRLSERVTVPADAGIGFRVLDDVDGVTFPVYDLSSAGLGFHPAADAALSLGQILQGELVLPDENPIPMCVEVRHLQTRREGRNAGVRIGAVSLAGRGRIARLLVALKG